MDMQEYDKVCTMTYLEYCDYLQDKYGIGKYDYMTKNFNKITKVTRTSEGLFAHHKMEDRTIMLSHKIEASRHPIEWQYKENIIYCDYLEHLLLHVLICKYPSPERETDGIGEGCVVNFIVPELNDMYSGFEPKEEWRKTCFNKVKNDKTVYLAIMNDFLSIKKEDYHFRPECMFKSFNEPYGLWSSKQNYKIYGELQDLLIKQGIAYSVASKNYTKHGLLFRLKRFFKSN